MENTLRPGNLMLGFRMLSPHSSLFPPRFRPARSLRNDVAPNLAHAARLGEISLFFHSTCRANFPEIAQPMRSRALESRTAGSSSPHLALLHETAKIRPFLFNGLRTLSNLVFSQLQRFQRFAHSLRKRRG